MTVTRLHITETPDSTSHDAVLDLSAACESVSLPGLVVRPARLGDVEQMHALVNHFAQEDLVLPRTLDNLHLTVENFIVCVDGDIVAGACSLHISSSSLAEIRSLCVRQEYDGRGIGSALTQACLAEARRLGVASVFALTYRISFFQRLGFHIVEKSTLPNKVWTDCIRCRKYDRCDETALVLPLAKPQ